MKIKAILIAATAVSLMSAPPAHAVGCLSGAVAGGVAGHYAGHHAVIGAIGGCIAGHHLKKMQARKRQEEANKPAPQMAPAQPQPQVQPDQPKPQ
jgi:outer membrane lipoprotein SlyB